MRTSSSAVASLLGRSVGIYSAGAVELNDGGTGGLRAHLVPGFKQLPLRGFRGSLFYIGKMA